MQMSAASVTAGRRATLWLLIVAFAAPLVVAPVMALGVPGRPIEVVGASLVGHLAAVVAAVVATGRWPLRATVGVIALLGAWAGLNWVLSQRTFPALVLATAVLGSVVGPLLLPALARLGKDQTRGIHARLDRAWKVSLRLTLVLGVALSVVHLAALVSYGALYRSVGEFPVALALTSMLSGATVVAGWHACVCTVRSQRALASADPGPLRPWLLSVLLVAGAGMGLTSAIVTVG